LLIIVSGIENARSRHDMAGAGVPSDLIILDLIIPAGDEGQDDCDELIGIRLAKKIRYLGLMIPIIVLSVVNDRQTIYELKNIGISEFLVKGRCLPSYLSSRVEYVLSEHNE